MQQISIVAKKRFNILFKRFQKLDRMFHFQFIIQISLPIFKYKENVREQKKLEEKCFILFLNPAHAELRHQEFEMRADQRHLRNLELELISSRGRCEIFQCNCEYRRGSVLWSVTVTNSSVQLRQRALMRLVSYTSPTL